MAVADQETQQYTGLPGKAWLTLSFLFFVFCLRDSGFVEEIQEMAHLVILILFLI